MRVLARLASCCLLAARCASAGGHRRPGARSVLRPSHGRRSRAGRLAGLQNYFETVAAASDRVELVDAGPTTEGRRLIAAIVSSPENIERLEEIRANSLRLADPRTLDEAAAHAIAEQQPVIVAIGMSIHATEIAATQTAPNCCTPWRHRKIPRSRTIAE